MKLDRLQLLLDLLDDLFRELPDEDFKNCLIIHEAMGTVNDIIKEKERKQ